MGRQYTCVLLTSERSDIAGAAEELARSHFEVRHTNFKYRGKFIVPLPTPTVV